MNDKLFPIDSERMLQMVLENVPMRVFWKDTNLNYLGANELFLKDAGLNSVNELVGKSDYDLCWGKEESKSFRADDRQVIQTGQAKINIEEPLSKAAGKTNWLQTNKIPLTDATGKVIGVLGTYEDITEQISYREAIEKQALLDPLTGLANRRQLHNVISRHKDSVAGLLFIDLDYFKTVNDTLGHSVGDTLLKHVAARLKGIIPEHTGSVARLGGDEFSIFTPFKGEENIEEKLEVIAQNILKVLVEPFTVNDHILNLGASVGITIICKGELQPSHSFREADMAMYAAKSKGRNNYQFYDQAMKKEVGREHLLQSNLRQAIENNEFSLLYQPQVNQAGELIGVEALLRWHNAELGGWVSPNEFISVAEKTGVIHKLGQWVFENALETLSSWEENIALLPQFKLAINASIRQFQSPKFVSQVKQAIESRNVSAHHIQIDVLV